MRDISGKISMLDEKLKKARKGTERAEEAVGYLESLLEIAEKGLRCHGFLNREKRDFHLDVPAIEKGDGFMFPDFVLRSERDGVEIKLPLGSVLELLVRKVGVERIAEFNKQISPVLKVGRGVEKVAKLGIKREPGWLYYLDKEGNISRKLMAREGAGEQELGRVEVVARPSIKKEAGFLYFLDKDGDVVRAKTKGGPRT